MALGVSRRLKRDDNNFCFCLVKEVHGLLATEALLNKLQIPTIIVLRDPVRIVDSLFDAQSMSTLYLTNEYSWIRKDTIFLDRYFAKNGHKIRSIFAKIGSWHDDRRKIIQQRILSASIVTRMLECVAKSSKAVYLVRYEDVCLFPQKYFAAMADFLGFAWTGSSVDAVLDVTTYKGEVSSPYSIKRDTSQQIDHPFRVLTQEEVEEAKEILTYCELDYSIKDS